jgi:hypothetical protein
VEIKCQLKSTVQFLLSSGFIFEGGSGGAEGEEGEGEEVQVQGGSEVQGIQGVRATLCLSQSGLFASCISQCNEVRLIPIKPTIYIPYLPIKPTPTLKSPTISTLKSILKSLLNP